MRIEENSLYLDEKLEYSDYEELLAKAKDVDKIVVETNDIHPAIFQILLCLTKKMKVLVEDPFNKRFFDNIKFSE